MPPQEAECQTRDLIGRFVVRACRLNQMGQRQKERTNSGTPSGFIDGQLPRVVAVIGLDISADDQGPRRSHDAAHDPWPGMAFVRAGRVGQLRGRRRPVLIEHCSANATAAKIVTRIDLGAYAYKLLLQSCSSAFRALPDPAACFGETKRHRVNAMFIRGEKWTAISIAQ